MKQLPLITLALAFAALAPYAVPTEAQSVYCASYVVPSDETGDGGCPACATSIKLDDWCGETVTNPTLGRWCAEFDDTRTKKIRIPVGIGDACFCRNSTTRSVEQKFREAWDLGPCMSVSVDL